MFLEKSVYPKPCLRGLGVLVLILLIAMGVGCSSRTPESDKLYSSGEGSTDAAMEKGASLQPEEPSPIPSPAVAPKPVVRAAYTAADREVVLR